MKYPPGLMSHLGDVQLLRWQTFSPVEYDESEVNHSI